MGCVLALAPFDLIDLLLDFKRFQVVELWLVRLKFGIELVFASLFLCERRIVTCLANAAESHNNSKAVSFVLVLTAHMAKSGTVLTNHFISFKQNHTPSLITRGEVISRRVELDGGYDIS